MKRIAGGLALAVAMSTVVVGGITTAAQAAVPSCVATTTWTSSIWEYAKATNNCSSQAPRLYFAWDWAADGPCSTLGKGTSRTEDRGVQARFAGLKSC